jgi:GntR family transcriptional regulator
MALGVSPETPVYRLSRLRFKGAMPVAIENTVVLVACLASESVIEESIYSAMQKSGRGPVRALQRLRAVSLDGNHAERLEVRPGSPGLFMERRGYLKTGQTAEVTRAWYRGDASDLISEVSVPNHLPETQISA